MAKLTVGNVYSMKNGTSYEPVKLDYVSSKHPGQARVTLMRSGETQRIDVSTLKGDGMPEAAYLALQNGESGPPTPAAAEPTPAAAEPTPAAAEPTPAAAGATKPTADKPKARAKTNKPKMKKAPKLAKMPRTKTEKTKDKTNNHRKPLPSMLNAAIAVLAKNKSGMNTADLLAEIRKSKLINFAKYEAKNQKLSLYISLYNDKKGRFEKATRGIWTLSKIGLADAARAAAAFA